MKRFKIKIWGSGAIGRGFIPWIFPEACYEFVDIKHTIDRRYTTYMAIGDEYESMRPILSDDNRRPDIMFCCVGTRACTSIADQFKDPSIPVYVLENDSRVVPVLRDMTGNDNIWFGIPDVITSNTAPPQLLQNDPLAVVTEQGYLYLPFGSCLPYGAHYLQEDMLNKQWKAKLYLHNTPHCIAAYLGYQKGYKYIHECMADEEIREIVRGVINECTRMVNNRYDLHLGFAGYYADKEILRFSNPLLYDPITRVAREPLRKLADGERLLGAARLCIQSNIIPANIIRGIKAAIAYDDPNDPDYGKPRDLGIAPDEPLSLMMERE